VIPPMLSFQPYLAGIKPFFVKLSSFSSSWTLNPVSVTLVYKRHTNSQKIKIFVIFYENGFIFMTADVA
jgi:hypothetical protein